MALDYQSPNTRLARELVEVAKEAERVSDTMRGINAMPQKFPAEALSEICVSLANLKNGTAEGCHEPLNFARYMLPLVRRDHFHIEGEEPELEDEEDIFFNRDHQLDQAITRLYGAVGTALDEYRSQAQGKYDDHVGAEETLEFSNDGTFADIDQRSKEVVQEAKEQRQGLSEMAVPESATADKLDRQIQDGANIAHSIRSQLRIRPVVARWYESANVAVRKLPDVMIATARAMRVGIDVGQIWVEQWSAFNKRLRHLGYDTLHSLADALQSTGERLKKQRRAARHSVERQRDPEVVAAEERVKELLISGEELPYDLARKVDQLLFSSFDRVANGSSEFERLENLTRLSLGKSLSGSDAFSAVLQLPKLKILQLNVDKVEEISALGQLPNLTSLTVNANSAIDISALGRLSNLTSLSVSANSAIDISALGQLPNLTSLTVNANSAIDISALGQLPNLTSLLVNANSAIDISALGQLSNLTSLTVQANSANDISALGQLSNLTSLSVQANSAIDISALGQLSNLTSLSLQANSAIDISALSQLSNLTSLMVHANSAIDISGFGQLSNLTSLSVHATAFDLNQIHELSQLDELVFSSVGELDLAPVAKVRSLKKLRLANVKYRNLDLPQTVVVEIVGQSKALD